MLGFEVDAKHIRNKKKKKRKLRWQQHAIVLTKTQVNRRAAKKSNWKNTHGIKSKNAMQTMYTILCFISLGWCMTFGINWWSSAVVFFFVFISFVFFFFVWLMVRVKWMTLNVTYKRSSMRNVSPDTMMGPVDDFGCWTYFISSIQRISQIDLIGVHIFFCLLQFASSECCVSQKCDVFVGASFPHSLTVWLL